jgi:mono/diheme cytochrome c family protein
METIRLNRLPAITVGLLLLLSITANAAVLDMDPDQVRKDLGHEAVEITVIEPHMMCGGAACEVAYIGIPLEKLMQYYFPGTWEGFNGVIHFYASDGYLAAIDTNKARSQDAWLTFARADGKPFRVDNEQQNERNLPLGPFYLVWDNLRNKALQQQGGYGWPYQVVRIELLPASVYDRLLPADAPPAIREGFGDWRQYCMGCHRIDGVGGTKNPTDMRALVKGKSGEELRAWISCPDSLRPGTTMPPLNVHLDRQERNQVIERISGYLETL